MKKQKPTPKETAAFVAGYLKCAETIKKSWPNPKEIAKASLDNWFFTEGGKA